MIDQSALAVPDSHWTAVYDAVDGLRLSSSFHSLVQTIQSLDPSSPRQWVKWKNYQNQVVIQTEDYFYKLYQVDHQGGEFHCLIREKLAEIYQSWGVHWEVRTLDANGGYAQLEQRQKLPLYQDACKTSFEDLLIQWSEVLEMLEEKLGLSTLCKQVQEFMPQVRRIRLVRDCVNKFADYAFFHGHVVLLDDADFFLACLDENDKILDLPYNVFPVIFLGQERLFAPNDFYSRRFDPLGCTGKKWNQWSVFVNSMNIDAQKWLPEMLDARQRMLQDNVHVLCDRSTKALNHPLYLQHGDV